MKRIQKFAAVNVLAALLGTGIPALAAQEGHDSFNRGAAQHVSVDHRVDNRDRDRPVVIRRDPVRTHVDVRGYAYVPAPVYQPTPRVCR